MWHGQKLLVHLKKMLNGVDVCPFKVAALHKKEQKMMFVVPGSNNEDFDFISGTRMRNMAKNNENPPQGFMSQKGWEVLAEYYRSLKDWYLQYSLIIYSIKHSNITCAYCLVEYWVLAVKSKWEYKYTNYHLWLYYVDSLRFFSF